MLERKILQDINQRQRERQEILASRQGREASPSSKTQLRRESKRRRFHRLSKQLAVLAVLFLAAAWMLLTYVFSHAEVTVVPQSRTAVFDASTIFTAYSEPGADELGFEYVVLSEEASREVPSGSLIEESLYATGTVLLKNELPTEQRLQAKTRLRSVDGKIYYLEDRGLTIPAGSESEPGEIEVIVTAAEPGEAYNLDEGVLVIPGWQELGDTERFENQYAEIATPVTGGFIGQRPALSEAEIASITEELSQQVSAILEQRLPQQAYDGFVWVPLADMVQFSPLTAESHNGSITVTLQGETPIVLFPEDAFVEYIASYTIPGYDLNRPEIRDREDFTIAITSLSGNTIQQSGGVSFALDGSFTLDAVVDPSTIQDQLPGMHQQEFEAYTTNQSNIQSATLVLRPLWRKKVPNSIEKVSVSIEKI